MRVLIGAVAVLALAAVPAKAASLNPFGDVLALCHPGKLIGHQFKADGTHTYRFKGQCDFGGRTWVENIPYFVDGTWDGVYATEHVSFIPHGGITAKALCVGSGGPVDPWIDSGLCLTYSISRSIGSHSPEAFLVVLDQWTPPYPHSASFVNFYERLILAEEAKKK